MKTKHISIRTRIIAINTFLIAVFCIFVFAYLLPKIEDTLIEKKKETLVEVIRVSLSFIDTLEQEHLAGHISLEEAQSRAIARLRGLRYEADHQNYVFISDLNGKLILHPYSPKLEGTDATVLTDPTGRHFLKDMVTIAKEQGSGFVTYQWQYYGDKNHIVPKIGYVETFKPWGWVIGSGLHIEEIRNEIRRLETTITITALIFFVITTLLIVYVANHIVKPIQKLRAASRLVAEGDLRSTVQITSTDETQDLAVDFNGLIQALRKILGSISEYSTNLASSTEQMASSLNLFTTQAQHQSASTEEIAATTEQLSAGMDTIQRGTDEQTSSVQSLITTMNGLSSSITQMGQQVNETQNETSQITDLAKEGEQSLGQLNDSMHLVLESSNSVSNIVQIISEISDRINLLSLNAAIEAARAGDAGRGFAVVAEEVGKLADRTGSSIRDISQLVTTNDQQIKGGIQQLESTTRFIQDILERVSRMNSRMNTLKSSMTNQIQDNGNVREQLQTVDNRSTEIRDAITEHKRAVAEIATTVSSINDAIQSVVAAAEEMNTTSDQIALMAGEMQKQTTIFKL
ncbi:MAG: methyl-accepting chemotaxis protein [Leptonema sp. (in: Bacteria)]|nr:methyl-accepting chemotaxis protein [Leptonema sp. (in: bacteria)]